jgi:hypothetical protein
MLHAVRAATTARASYCGVTIEYKDRYFAADDRADGRRVSFARRIADEGVLM